MPVNSVPLDVSNGGTDIVNTNQTNDGLNVGKADGTPGGGTLTVGDSALTGILTINDVAGSNSYIGANAGLNSGGWGQLLIGGSGLTTGNIVNLHDNIYVGGNGNSNGFDGGQGTIDVAINNILKLNGTTTGTSKIEIGGNGGNGLAGVGGVGGAGGSGASVILGAGGTGGAGANGVQGVGNNGNNGGLGANGEVGGAGGIEVTGNFANLSLGGTGGAGAIGGQGGQGGGGQGGQGGGVGSGSSFASGTAGANGANGLLGNVGGNGGAGAAGGSGKLTITSGTANLGVIQLGGGGGAAGAGAQGGTGGQGGNGGNAGTSGTYWWQDSLGSWHSASTFGGNGGGGGQGGTGGQGGQGGTGGAGGQGELNLLGGSFTAASLAVGGAGGNGGHGGDVGSNGGSGANGNVNASSGGHGGHGGNGGLSGTAGAGGTPSHSTSNAGVGGAGGAGGQAGQGAEGGAGILNMNNATLAVTGASSFGGNGGHGGTGGIDSSGWGNLAGAASDGKKGGDATVNLSNNAVLSAASLQFGGAGGLGGHGGTGSGSYASNGAAAGAGGNVIAIIDQSNLLSSGLMQVGGRGGNAADNNNKAAGNGGIGGTASVILQNGSDSEVDRVVIGGTGGDGVVTGSTAGAGGAADLSVLSGSTLKVNNPFGIRVGGYQGNIGNFDKGGNGLLTLGGGSTIKSNITLDARQTAVASSSNALFNVNGGINFLEGNIDIFMGKMNVGYYNPIAPHSNSFSGNLNMHQIGGSQNTITLDSQSAVADAQLNVDNNSWLLTDATKVKSGQIYINKNSVFVSKDFDALSAVTGSSFHIGADNGVAIIGDDSTSWDSTGHGPNYQIDLINWHKHQLFVAGKNPEASQYKNGTLAFMGFRDPTVPPGTTPIAVSLDLSKLDLGVGTATVAPGSSGAFGNNSLTVINAPDYIYNNDYYNYNAAQVAAIKIDAGNGSVVGLGNPFAGNDAQLLLVVDDNTKIGNKLDVLENTGGSFNTAANQNWLKDGNAFSTSRLLSVTVTQSGDRLIAQFGDAKPAQTMPGLSPEVAQLFTDMATQVGHVVGLNSVNGNEISSGVHFVSRLSDFKYMISGEDAARAAEGAVRMASVAGAQGAVIRANTAAAGVVHSRAQNVSGKVGSSFSSSVANSPYVYSFADGRYTSASDNGSGFAVWGMPLYQNTKVKGIEVGAFKMGYDGDFIAGVFGADYTFDNRLRLGVELDVGTGTADSNGDFMPTKNEFDFYGASLYAGYSYGNFSISGDIGYTHNKNKIRQKVAPSMLMDDLTADVDGSVLGAGVRAEYMFPTASVDITPYAGARWISVKTDDYKVLTNPNYSPGSTGHVLSVTEATQNIIRFPVGLRLSKEIEAANGGMFKPHMELGAIFATGDLDAESVTRIPGVNSSATLTTPVHDKTTFDVKLGLGYKLKKLDLSLDYNYQNSKHRDGHTVLGSVRYEF